MPALPTIAELLRSSASGGRGPTFSFEFFPPKTETGERHLWQAIAELEVLRPDFVSVTYGASGSTRDRTLAATARLAAHTSLRTMGHLTCASQSVAELDEVVEGYAAAGVQHILAIRGDPPGGPTAPWQSHPEGLATATELVGLIRRHGDFCVGVAAFPDVHPERRDAALDARVLKAKADAGASFAITQLFFDPAAYTALVERVRALGCDLPIVPGIMPVTNLGQLERFAELSGAALPARVVQRISAVGDDPERVREIGVQIGTELAQELLDRGAPGLHFFTQNRSRATREIYARLVG